jgi:hypothetical protein
LVKAKENIQKRHFISPDDTLDPITSSGVPLQEAYRTWLSFDCSVRKKPVQKWIGAILNHSSMGKCPIGYAQHLEIESCGENFWVSFGETTIGGNKKDFDWQIANARLTT